MVDRRRARSAIQLILPLEPEAQLLIDQWQTIDRVAFSSLLMQYARIHYAVHGQKDGAALTPVRAALDKWEDEMLDTFLELESTLVPRIESGSASEKTIASYRFSTTTLFLHHQENYLRLRNLFDVFLEG